MAVILLVHPSPPLLASGTVAPAVRLSGSDGATVTAVAARPGRAALLEFLSTTCSTCEASLPSLCRAAASRPAATVVGVDAALESRSALGAFAQRLPSGCRLALLLDPGLRVSQAYEITVLPTLYVVDTSGRVAYGGFGAAAVPAAIAALDRVSRSA